ncbi:hypothetical protein GOP47_0005586 [Adiantum capillus-veneris]|uniref:Uncharacterized protein n=1 Tax=Adiantum capillus-veneris TaxID=13818 RepID=A0A9D4ZND6_ADICA|nr:hypothetical protein GOP47_0005586 [Adiantum capillus-veneris]
MRVSGGSGSERSLDGRWGSINTIACYAAFRRASPRRWWSAERQGWSPDRSSSSPCCCCGCCCSCRLHLPNDGHKPAGLGGETEGEGEAEGGGGLEELELEGLSKLPDSLDQDD